MITRTFIFVLLFVAPAAHALTALEKACAKIVTQVPAADPRVLLAHAIGQGLDMDNVRARLEELSGVRPMADGTYLKERGTDANRMIARLRIHEMLKQAGLRPRFENFPNGSNIIAEIKGSKSPHQVLELSAHYDSVGNPGADDNGSGLALVLELAAYMRRFKPEITIRFVITDLEERGMQGSRYHAEQVAKDNKNEIIGAIVIDTIGWAPEGGEHYLAVVEVGEERHQDSSEAYALQEKFAAGMFYLLNRIGRRDGIRFSPETEGAMPGTADHGSYWRNGIPAILIAAVYERGFVNPHYHRPTDTVDNMNWNYYGLVARVVAELTAYVSGASRTLSSDDITAFAALENTEATFSIEVLRQSLPRAAALPPPPPAREEIPSNIENGPRGPGLFTRIFDFFWKRN